MDEAADEDFMKELDADADGMFKKYMSLIDNVYSRSTSTAGKLRIISNLAGIIENTDSVERMLMSAAKGNMEFDPLLAEAIRCKLGFNQASLARSLIDKPDDEETMRVLINRCERQGYTSATRPQGDFITRYLKFLARYGYDPYDVL